MELGKRIKSKRTHRLLDIKTNVMKKTIIIKLHK